MYIDEMKNWSKDLGIDPISFHEFNARFYNSGRTLQEIEDQENGIFTILIENVLEDQLFRVSCDYLRNTVTVEVIEAWISGEPKPEKQEKKWKYDQNGDEHGRAGRIARWFIRRLDDPTKFDKIVGAFPDMARGMLAERPDLENVNVLFTASILNGAM